MRYSAAGMNARAFGEFFSRQRTFLEQIGQAQPGGDVDEARHPVARDQAAHLGLRRRWSLSACGRIL